jgi:methionyl aminopeptidase
MGEVARPTGALILASEGMKEQGATRAMGRNDPCWCGSGLKYKKCHLGKDGDAAHAPAQPVAAPPRQLTQLFSRPRRAGALIKTPEQIAGIREAGVLAWALLEMLEERIRPGISTEDINTWVHTYTEEHGGVSAPLNYKGFPKSVCTSVNEVVCHGIPAARVLEEGDIVNVDVTPILRGYYGDSSRMYAVGRISAEAERLVRVTRECLERGIAQVRPGGHLGDIGHAIQTHAEGHGYSVVRDFVGHGTGVRFHEDPQVPHFGRPGTGHPMLPGMVFTIEPMINLGDWHVRILDDNWTAVTKDGSLSAQWEHTVTVTQDGVQVLTAAP